MQRKHLIYLTISLFLVLSLVTTISYAQEEEMAFHGLEPENNAFQDAFFAALRYKAIGNYRLALQALDKAELEAREEKDKLEVIGFERAQNHYYLKEHQESILLLEKLLETNKQREVLDWLYQSYMEVREYKEAKETIVQLLEYSEVYLPNFYMLYMELTHDPNEALQVLTKTFETKNNTKQVGFYKGMIRDEMEGKELVEANTDSNSSEKEIQKLQSFLEQESWDEARMYMELLLQDENNVRPIWHQLEFSGNLKQAFQSVEKIFTKGNIPNKSKLNLLTAIIEGSVDKELFAKFIDSVYRNLDATSLKYLGDYFIDEADKEKAKLMYLNSLAISFDNYSLIIEVLQLLSETKDYNEQLELATNAMNYYPMQPVLYFYKGEALIGVEQWSKAKDVLEEGASYIIDQPELEKEFADLLQKVPK